MTPPLLIVGARVTRADGYGPCTVTNVVPERDGSVFVGLRSPTGAGHTHVNRARCVDGVWRDDHGRPLRVEAPRAVTPAFSAAGRVENAGATAPVRPAAMDAAHHEAARARPARPARPMVGAAEQGDLFAGVL